MLINPVSPNGIRVVLKPKKEINKRRKVIIVINIYHDTGIVISYNIAGYKLTVPPIQLTLPPPNPLSAPQSLTIQERLVPRAKRPSRMKKIILLDRARRRAAIAAAAATSAASEVNPAKSLAAGGEMNLESIEDDVSKLNLGEAIVASQAA